jgi:hypothetical protein
MNSSKNNGILKTVYVIELVLSCVILCGCEEAVQREPVNKSLVNTELINTLNDLAIENAIVNQHTLYPYHFVDNSEQLNELGRRDLDILASHFKQYPGKLNISSDGTDERLYQGRLTYITEQLDKAGVDLFKVTISDGTPGGSGMASSDVLQIKEADQNARNDRRRRYPTTYDNSSSQ